MKHRRRIYYSAEQRAEIWDRWKRGESAHEIGRLFDRGYRSAQSEVLAATSPIVMQSQPMLKSVFSARYARKGNLTAKVFAVFLLPRS